MLRRRRVLHMKTFADIRLRKRPSAVLIVSLASRGRLGRCWNVWRSLGGLGAVMVAQGGEVIFSSPFYLWACASRLGAREHSQAAGWGPLPIHNNSADLYMDHTTNGVLYQ
ncbi:uncharacterized protein LY79DRAFT_585010 [Colletotrichum navitas]|uniref:Uncharacterized protein n=1 Tax=Colletotrichum navitas TaxID=681940 RepID=A0AAD8PKQ5_9PEZI|nr:uncharacterized protein LY79DRAFT_585010 [Colletotrichum navitas]KAK1566096.1 hypothetical protein LY79DRAFT_585010 [Colletotrichum navitas]